MKHIAIAILINKFSNIAVFLQCENQIIIVIANYHVLLFILLSFYFKISQSECNRADSFLCHIFLNMIVSE